MVWRPLIILCVFSGFAAQGARASVPDLGPGARPGYVFNVDQERHERSIEMVIDSPPEDRQKGKPLITTKMEKEFQDQYELRFGWSDAERNYNGTNRFAFYEYPSGQLDTIQIYQTRQRQFGEYMVRRLVEYHVDDYFKSNPEMRPIYELKDRIANVDVQVRKGYKVKLRYSYSGNYLDVLVDNPYNIESKVSLMMKPGGFGPGPIQDSVFKVAYPVDPRTSVATYYATHAGEAKVVGTRRLSKSLSSSLTVTEHSLVDPDNPETSPRQNLVLVGLSWNE